MSQNKIILVGNIGKEPEMINFPNGGSILKISLATKEVWRDQNTNELKEQTDWHNIVFKNKKAETAQQFLRKGDKLFVEGRLTYKKWTDNKGSNHNSAEIIVLAFDTMSSNNRNSQPLPTQNQHQPPHQYEYGSVQESPHMRNNG